MITELTSKEPKSDDRCITITNDPQSAIPIEKNLAHEKKLNRLRETLSYQIAYGKETFSDELWQAMEYRGLNQVGFARKAKVSKQFLTKVFRGGNCTIETMVRLAFGLNYRCSIHLTPKEIGCAWIHSKQLPESAPRPPDRFLNLFVETGYSNIDILNREDKRELLSTDS